MEKTNKKTRGLDKRVSDLENQLKRTLADYANLEKRIEKEKKEFVKFSNAVLLDKLLSVLDNLERAERHLKNKGLTMAVDQMKLVMQNEGVTEIKAKGKEFDAEAMDCSEVVEGPENVVVEVVEKGYKLNDKVLRPTKVRVGQGKLKKKGTPPTLKATARHS